MDDRENIPHPLFPPSDDSDDDSPAPLVSEIVVHRQEQGKKVTAPRMFRGEELQSLTELSAQYGGGEYELVSRHLGRITARRRYNIPGTMKPMYDVGIIEPESRQETKAPQPAQVINPMQALMGSDGGGVMGLIMMMMQQMMQQQAAQSAQTMQLFMTMMQTGGERSKEEREEQRRAYELNIERERVASERNMTLMRELLQNRPAGGSSEDFTRGVEFMRSFAINQIETAKTAAGSNGDSELEKLLGTGLELFQGFMQFKQMQGGDPPLPSSPPELKVVT